MLKAPDIPLWHRSIKAILSPILANIGQYLEIFLVITFGGKEAAITKWEEMRPATVNISYSAQDSSLQQNYLTKNVNIAKVVKPCSLDSFVFMSIT